MTLNTGFESAFGRLGLGSGAPVLRELFGSTEGGVRIPRVKTDGRQNNVQILCVSDMVT